MSKTKQKKHGFTIIEVVLVLAIAGLIFLMVFIALPALQRGQRDTQRKNDLARIMTKINDFSTNNRGTIPSATQWTVAYGTPAQSFVRRYLGTGTGATNTVAGSDFSDPQTNNYIFVAPLAGAAAPVTTTIGTIYYNTGAVCDVDGATIAGTARQYTLRMRLEGQTSLYCVDNR